MISNSHTMKVEFDDLGVLEIVSFPSLNILIQIDDLKEEKKTNKLKSESFISPLI